MTLRTVEAAWQQLDAAASGAYAPWKHGVLCTRRGDGADGRMVVLRRAVFREARLQIYSDCRAEKIAQCTSGVAMVFWDADTQYQLRLGCVAGVHRNDAEADACWSQVPRHSRANYQAASPPGTVVDGPKACANLAASDGRENFAVIDLNVRRMDMLWLRDKRRLQAVRQGHGWGTSWVQL